MSIYSKIPYDTHANNANDSLHQGNDESKIVYIHRVQDILECIHHVTGPTGHLQKVYNNHQHDQINPNVGITKEITSKMTVPQPVSKVLLNQSTNQLRKSCAI